MIIRREKTDNYSVICNECLRDNSVSARSKGIFAYIMTLPDDWVIHMSELTTHFKDGRDSIRKGIHELENLGYVRRTRERCPDGTLGDMEYTVYETRSLNVNFLANSPGTGLPTLEKPTLDNPTLLSTEENQVLNIENTDRASALENVFQIQSKSESQDSVGKKRKKRGAPPSLEEVIAFATTAAPSEMIAVYCEEARKAYAYYQGNMETLGSKTWLDKNGNPVGSWKLSIKNNWLEKIGRSGNLPINMDAL